MDPQCNMILCPHNSCLHMPLISGYTGHVTWHFWAKNCFVYILSIELHVSCYRFFLKRSVWISTFQNCINFYGIRLLSGAYGESTRAHYDSLYLYTINIGGSGISPLRDPFLFIFKIFFSRCLQNCSLYPLLEFGCIRPPFWTHLDVNCKAEKSRFSVWRPYFDCL